MGHGMDMQEIMDEARDRLKGNKHIHQLGMTKTSKRAEKPFSQSNTVTQNQRLRRAESKDQKTRRQGCTQGPRARTNTCEQGSYVEAWRGRE